MFVQHFKTYERWKWKKTIFHGSLINENTKFIEHWRAGSLATAASSLFAFCAETLEYSKLVFNSRCTVATWWQREENRLRFFLVHFFALAAEQVRNGDDRK